MAKVPSSDQFWIPQKWLLEKSLCDMFPSSCATPEHIFHPKYQKNKIVLVYQNFKFSMKWFE